MGSICDSQQHGCNAYFPFAIPGGLFMLFKIAAVEEIYC